MKKIFPSISLTLCLLTIAFHVKSEPQFNIGIENHYYTWKSTDGRQGFQNVTPINLSYQKGAFNLGVRRAFIDSENQSPEQEGKLSDWSDTSLSLAYTAFQEKNYPIRFNLSANIPNGKATLYGDEKNAIMDGNLVWQTRLGEGLNITPGLNIAHSFTNQDTIGFGVSRIFRGEFDPNGDVENDKIDPGDDTIVTLQYARTGQKGKVQTSLTHQHSGVTMRDGKPYYKKGRLWTGEVNGHFSVTPNQTIYGGYAYSYRYKDKYINNLTGDLEAEQFNSNGGSHWFNLGYDVYLNNKHSIGASADYLKIKSNDYDQINALYVPARTKTGIGLNYQYEFSPKTRFSLSAKHFKMNDDATPYLDKQSYKGWNMFSSINYTF